MPRFTVPLARRSHESWGLNYFQVPLTLQARPPGRAGWTPLPVILDTGADLTTLSAAAAAAVGLPLEDRYRIRARSATGDVTAHLARYQFHFPEAPEAVFNGVALVLSRMPEPSLLSLRDVHPHFLMRFFAADEVLFDGPG
jgi:hypothetical protein